MFQKGEDGSLLNILSENEKLIKITLSNFFEETDIVYMLNIGYESLYLTFAHSEALIDLLMREIYYGNVHTSYNLETNLNKLFSKIDFKLLNKIFGPDGENKIEWNELYKKLKDDDFKIANRPELITKLINFFVKIHFRGGDGLIEVDYIYGQYYNPTDFLIEIDPRFEEALYLHKYLKR